MATSPKDYAFRLLGRREYSVFELREKLAKKFPQETEDIEAVMQEFQEKEYVSDDRFTELFVRNQLFTTKAGPFVIRQKLKKKGIEEALAEKWITFVFGEKVQKEVLEELALKKWNAIRSRGKGETNFERKQKVMAYLVGKGYSYDKVREVLETNPG